MPFLFYLLQSFQVISSADSQPEQIHLSWTANPSEMQVTWTTYYSSKAEILYKVESCDSEVQSTEWLSVNATSKLFDAGDYYTRYQFIHTGVIAGLNESCTYSYKVGDSRLYSSTFQFSGRTPTLVGSQDSRPSEFVVIGDWGSGELGLYTYNFLLKQLSVRSADAIIHIGDIAYDLSDEEGMVGDAFMNMIQPIAANYAYMTLPGNHEGHNNFTHYRQRFYMPVNEYNEGTNFFYSFNYGKAHYIMFDTEFYFTRDRSFSKIQMEWLKKDLEIANSNRGTRPWVIFLTHHGVYCSVNPFDDGGECTKDAPLLQKALEEVLYTNAVDIVFQGHMHFYERCTPIYKDQVVASDIDSKNKHVGPKAPIYITNGNGGNYLGHNDPVSPYPETWSVAADGDFGYGRLIVHNSTHLYYEQFNVEKKAKFDHVWVIKTAERYN